MPHWLSYAPASSGIKTRPLTLYSSQRVTFADSQASGNEGAGRGGEIAVLLRDWPRTAITSERLEPGMITCDTSFGMLRARPIEHSASIADKSETTAMRAMGGSGFTIGATSGLATPASATAEGGALAAGRRREQDALRWQDGRQQPAGTRRARSLLRHGRRCWVIEVF